MCEFVSLTINLFMVHGGLIDDMIHSIEFC